MSASRALGGRQRGHERPVGSVRGHHDAISPVDPLALRSRETGVSHQCQERPLERTVAAGVDEELVEQADSVAARSPQVGQAAAEEGRRGQPVTDGAVDGSFEIAEPFGAGEVDDGPSGRGARERSDRGPIDRIQALGGVHGPAGPFASLRARDRELDGPGRETVEAVQRRGRPPGDHRSVPEIEQACHQLLLPGRWRADEPQHSRAHPFERAVADVMADLGIGQTARARLCGGHARVLARGEVEQLLVWSHTDEGVPQRPEIGTPSVRVRESCTRGSRSRT